MAELTLREYIKFIEGRFDREDYRDAVEHSRHILETYPKYVDAYRVLARALLEQEKYQDALDMFQRVLSTDPNDFVAHIGISECYRESNAIEQAIWHLERAFEQVPNNQELQEEIKRLYGMRGGLGAAAPVPRKIPLTKGALARLYAKGDLYEQAIPELSAAIEEDSERLDLQVLLAETLWRAHEEVKAGRVAAQVLKRLPNCVSANRILGQLWLMAGQEKEARPFLLQLRELDPYIAYLLEHPGEDVPADQFSLTKLDYSARDEVAGQLGWVSEIDAIEKRQGITGPLPSLPDIASAQTPVEPNTPVTPRKPMSLSRQAPDWLSEALSDEPTTTQPDTDEFQAGELRALLGIDEAEVAASTTATSVTDLPTSSESSDEGIPSWLEETLAEDTGPNVNVDELKDEPPDWLQGVLKDDQVPENKVASLDNQPVVQSNDSAPRNALTVQSIEQDTVGPDTPVNSEQVTSTPTSNEEDSMIPDDMNDEAPDWMLSGDLDSDDALAWLEELAAKYDPDFEKTAGDEEETVEETLVMKKPTTPEDMETQPAPPVMDAADDDLPDWLKEPGDALAAAPAVEDDLPDWLKEDATPTAEEKEPETEPVRPPGLEAAAAAAATSDAEDDLPDWLTEMESISADDTGDDDLDWLRSPAEEARPALAASADDDLPDWLRQSAEETPAPAGETPPAPAAVGSSDAMSWLDEQVAEQGVDPDKVVSEALEKDRPSTNGVPIPDLDAAAVEPDDDDLPDWLKEASADAEASGKVRETDDFAGLTDDLEIESDGALGWLEGALGDDDDEFAKLLEADEDESKPTAPAPEPSVSNDDDADLPAWLKGIADDPAEEEAAVGSDLPDWLGVPSEPTAESSSASDDLPSWLGDVAKPQEEPAQPPAPAEKAPEPMAAAEPTDEDDLPDWLKGFDEAEDREPMPSLAASPAPAVETETPAADDSDDSDDLPDWLKGEPDLDIGEPAEAVAAVMPAAVTASDDADSDDLPDWLKGVDEESEAPAAEIEQTDAGQLFEPAIEEEEALPAWLKEEAEKDAEPEAAMAAPETIEKTPDPAPPVKETGGLTGWLQAVEPAESLSDMEREITPAEPEPMTAATPAASITPVEQAAAVALPGADLQDYGQWLTEGRNQLEEKNVDLALSAYESLVNSGQLLNETIADLSAYLNEQSGDNPQVRRIIGDALMAQGRLQDALDMYRNALDTL